MLICDNVVVHTIISAIRHSRANNQGQDIWGHNVKRLSLIIFTVGLVDPIVVSHKVENYLKRRRIVAVVHDVRNKFFNCFGTLKMNIVTIRVVRVFGIALQSVHRLIHLVHFNDDVFVFRISVKQELVFISVISNLVIAFVRKRRG